MRKLIALTAALVVAILLVTEAAMQPSPRDRAILITVFGLAFALTVMMGWLLLRLAHRIRTLRTAFILIPVGAVGVAAITIGAAAFTMFLSAHDLRLTLVALGLGVGLGTALAVTVSRPLAGDLRRLSETAARVAEGDVTARTGVSRPDEVGELARAMDGMIGELAGLEEERARNEESRRTFLAAIGHDLRTPLTSLQAAVEALQDGIAPDPDRYLRSMARDLQTLRGLVDDLFMLTRIETRDLELQPVAVDAAELVDEILEAMRPLGESRHVRLVLDTEGPAPVEADPRAMARVVRNLVDNAVRHTGPDTEVRVRVEREPGGVLVRVKDQGPGFPEGFRHLAWEDAVRGDASRSRDGGGAGLGLTIARGLVEAHQGEIWIGEGEGGEVAFRLPSERGLT
ncbi:MAG: sensor histidine kinase [Actinomycetota bacterium]